MIRGEIVYYGRGRRAIIQNFLEAVIPTAPTPNVNNGRIGKVKLNSKFGALFVNVPDSSDNNEFGLHGPYLPLLGNLQLIKPDKVSVSGNQNCANM